MEMNGVPEYTDCRTQKMHMVMKKHHMIMYFVGAITNIHAMASNINKTSKHQSVEILCKSSVRVFS